jgi:UDP-N-acetyl-D-galactosamine dehydrogenase
MKIGVIGLGYVGLPLAIAFARQYPGTIGFDASPGKVAELNAGRDRTGEIQDEGLRGTSLVITHDPEALAACTFFVVAVPTPIDAWNRPDLSPLVKASETVGRYLKDGDIVVYESTVSPASRRAGLSSSATLRNGSIPATGSIRWKGS